MMFDEAKFIGVVALLALPSCNLFSGEDGEKSGSVVPSKGGTGGAVAGGAGGAGAAAPGGAGGTSAAGGSASGGASSKCDGLPGPAMAQLKAPDGTPFCIDRTEVTEGQYAEFLAKTKATPGSEHADCATNQTYYPSVKPAGPPWEPVDCESKYWTPDTTPNRPVVCIEWCDAFAYCAWAGKRLCGKIGGGRGEANGDPAALPNDALDASKSQWFSACSQAGKTKYPYGDTYVSGRCAGGDVSKEDGGTGWAPRKDVGSYPQCRGANEPWKAVVDMSGSVAEFTDECATMQTPAGPQPSCIVRSGSYRHSADALTCPYYGTTTAAAENYGFRCCKDLP